MPCPYLPGKTEQQLFTELNTQDAAGRYELLSQGGFRRSHHIAYRPACNDCEACVPVRIVVPEFRLNKTWRRTLRNNIDLTLHESGPYPTDEQYDLFHRYMHSRHHDGEMVRMRQNEYFEMVVSSPVHTTIFEYRDDAGKLVAACLTDHLRDGYSAVYSFFEPELTKRSLGSYMILSLIQRAKLKGLPYVYLGFWIEGSQKMLYKKRFKPMEGFRNDGWYPMDPA